MMRAAETQCEVLRELRQMTDDDVHVSGDDELFSLLEDVFPGEEVAMASPAALSRSHRGARIRVHDLELVPGMSVLGSLLGEDADCSLFVSSSVSFYCTFEWGADTVVQTACATESYLGKACYDHIWYSDSSGQRRLGWARLIVRKLAGAVDDLVVVWRMEEVCSLPDCPLTRSGCKRMAWSFDAVDAEWPALDRVPLASVLRVEHVVPDFQDLGDRHGLRAVPSNTPNTAVERRAQRFFTNHFYTFTSRVLNPSS